MDSIIKNLYSPDEDFNKIFHKEKYRISQIKNWIFKKLIFDFNDMTNLPKILREDLSKQFYILSLDVVDVLIEEITNTRKFKLKTKDGYIVEMVLLDDNNRFTLCISSQIGCPVGCKFCATGRAGYKRNLSFSEILSQFLIANKYLRGVGNVDNIVFMGMGEPLLNFDNVVKSIEILNDSAGANFSTRRITISTVGIPDKIKLIADKEIKVKLSFSLHSTTNDKRKYLIPSALDLDKILKSLLYYRNKTHKRVTIEYIMIKGYTDKEIDKNNLVKIALKLGKFVNLIEYNPVKGINFEPSDKDKIKEFKYYLEKNNINVVIRYKRGSKIKGACGQLIWEEGIKNEH